MTTENLLASIKLRLGLDDASIGEGESLTVDVDALLLDIIEDIKTQLTIMTGNELYPEGLDFVTKEVAVIRYNRLGSEGMEQESVDGHTMKYLKSDYAPFEHFINHFTKPSGDGSSDGWTRGEVEFI